jgi:hypothetical protein
VNRPLSRLPPCHAADTAPLPAPDDDEAKMIEIVSRPT